MYIIYYDMVSYFFMTILNKRKRNTQDLLAKSDFFVKLILCFVGILPSRVKKLTF